MLHALDACWLSLHWAYACCHSDEQLRKASLASLRLFTRCNTHQMEHQLSSMYIVRQYMLGSVQGIVHSTTAIVTHPTKPVFIIAGQAGVLQTWDLLSHALLQTHQLASPTPITCMAFSHDGTILALGGALGVVRLCKEGDCEPIADFRPVKQVHVMNSTMDQ